MPYTPVLFLSSDGGGNITVSQDKSFVGLRSYQSDAPRQSEFLRKYRDISPRTLAQ